MLADLELRPEYTKGSDDIAGDFYMPCMTQATAYDRITGYFSSTVYAIAWPAMRDFVDRGGHIRIICSPVMSAGDIEALQNADEARQDQVLAASLLNELDALLQQPLMEKVSRGLACLVVAGVVDIKVAMLTDSAPASSKRLFHDKVGLFHDSAGGTVGFRGSMNETYLGLSPGGNLESIDVFPSWEGGRDRERVRLAAVRFEALWRNDVDGVTVKDLPDAVQETLVEAGRETDWEIVADDLANAVAATGPQSEDSHRMRVGGRVLLDHQDAIIRNWIANDRRGIVEAATGAGKTTIGIAAAHDAMSRGRGVLVLVPSTLLLDQWVDEVRVLLPDVKVLRLGDGDRAWTKPGVLRRIACPHPDEKRIAVATMQTASQRDFMRLLPPDNRLLLVADEVHRLGSVGFGRVLELDCPDRLGLSATPHRYGDESGTQRLLAWFGGILEPRYCLRDALDAGVLTRYAYHPHHVELSEDEHERWKELTQLIGRRTAMLGDEARGDDSLKKLLIRRARIAKTASAKTRLAERVLVENFQQGHRWLVYCDNQDQVADVRASLTAANIPNVEYHSSMLGDRRTTLKDFELNGGVVVAIRCLDEGVDIPAVTHALILASSRNPREFIQRRGRVLRRHRTKSLAHVHDAIITPPLDTSEPDRLLLAELARAVEFAATASNRECQVDLDAMCARRGINPSELRDVGEEEEDQDGD